MARSSSPARKIIASVAVLAAVSVFVSFGVFSAFSDTKSNSSSLSSATFGLTQLPGTSSLLSDLTNLVPGDLLTKCVKVTNTGSVPVTVSLHPSITSVSGILNTLETMTFQEVSNVDTTDASTIGSCTAQSGQTVTATSTIVNGIAGSALSSSYSLAGSGGSTWAANESHVYRVLLSLPSSATTTVAGSSATAAVNFVADQVAGTNR